MHDTVMYMIYCNDIPVTILSFPNGEIHVAREQAAFAELGSETRLRLSWRSDADLLHLYLIGRYVIEQAGAATLSIDYMPYSRMDRTTGDLFSLREVARLINSLGFRHVSIVEPHSDVTLALVERSEGLYPSQTWLLETALADIGFTESDLLFFPDAGAQKRYGALTENYRHLVGVKHRGTHGELAEDYRVLGPQPREDSKIVIVDDLCSYGGTFLAAANALSQMGATALWLVVTHLEASYWKGTLATRVHDGPSSPDAASLRGVYATNSLYDPRHDGGPSDFSARGVHLYDVATHEALI